MASRMSVSIGFDADEHPMPSAAEYVVKGEVAEPLPKFPISWASVGCALEQLGIDFI
jgi:hypothetical protein